MPLIWSASKNSIEDMMKPAVQYQAVVLAGGYSGNNLYPLVSKESPRALLAAGNKPLLLYSLELLEGCGIVSVLVVVSGNTAAELVAKWVRDNFKGRLLVEVASTPDGCGSADALRIVVQKLTAENVLVLSVDVISDFPLGSVAATHKQHDADVTVVLYKRRALGAGDGASSHGSLKEKSKSKDLGAQDIVGLDASMQQLLVFAPGAKAGAQLHVQRSLIRTVGQMTLHTDFSDGHIYAFKRESLVNTLSAHPSFSSIRNDLLPFFVSKAEQHRQLFSVTKTSDTNCIKTCCVQVVTAGSYYAHLDTLQAYGDINRELSAEAIHLTSYNVSKIHNNVVHETCELGPKSTIGAQCIVGEGTRMGEKCSIKKSVVGRFCSLGSGVKIVNSVLMDRVSISDGCVVQNCVLSNQVVVQEQATLKDCQVGEGYTVVSGSECKGEILARKEK